jgi:hypothetical protein
MKTRSVPTQTDKITFNGDIGLFTDEVVEALRVKNFDHFSHVSLAHLTLSSNKKTPTELVNEFGKKDENIIISFPKAHEFIPDSFKVFFIKSKDGTEAHCINADQYDCVVILDNEKKPEEVAERITVAYGYWTLGRTTEKIIQ